MIVKLLEKSNLKEFKNCRGFTLLPVVSKVMRKIVIERIRSGVRSKLRKDQAGFRWGRRTPEQIFILRNIIKKSIEWQSTLYIHFMDFEKAFAISQQGQPLADNAKLGFAIQDGQHDEDTQQRL